MKDDTISILSELRSNYNCFASVDEPYYHALTEAIEALNDKDTDVLSKDTISRQAAIDAILHNQEVYSKYFGDDPIAKYTIAIIDNDAQTIAQLPSVQPEGWMERNKERILQAGMERREIEFRIGGRLFAIREKAQ